MPSTKSACERFDVIFEFLEKHSVMIHVMRFDSAHTLLNPCSHVTDSHLCYKPNTTLMVDM
jgi:hypothetical protein